MMGGWSVKDLKVGDRVEHVKEPGRPGKVVHVEDNRLSVMVLWDDLADLGEVAWDFQWANKVRRIDEL